LGSGVSPLTSHPNLVGPSTRALLELLRPRYKSCSRPCSPCCSHSQSTTEQIEIMPQLDDLPDELLLNVAYQLAHDSRPIRFRLHDLCSFTLTSKKYRGIVQEVLHHSIVIKEPVAKPNVEGRLYYRAFESATHRSPVPNTTGTSGSGAQSSKCASVCLGTPNA
jgi:hypothetical protein